MILNDTLLQSFCFFTLGFLCLVGFISLHLSFLFKSKVYFYYFGYIISLIIFISCVYFKSINNFPRYSSLYNFYELTIDVVQIISNFMFGGFLYNTLIYENQKFKKLNFLFKFYGIFTILYIFIIILFPNFVIKSYPFFIGTRLIILLLSLIFYYHIAKEFKKNYFKFLFSALTSLLLFGLLAFSDSIFKPHKGLYTGFEYLCLGYIFENISFAGAFIYKYFSVNKQKNEAEITHELQLSVVQLEMQQQTMQHIGREIHDNIGQKLTLASLYTQQLAHENKAPLIKNSIDNISDIINQSLRELRQLTKTLTDNNIERNSINQLLEIECNKFNDLKKCKITFSDNKISSLLTYQSKSILLRIFQEFIQNSIKHSHCKNIYASLYQTNNKFKLSLQDDGKGFDVEKSNKNGMGLNNIKSRIKLINGTYSLESNKNNGTKLTLEIPI